MRKYGRPASSRAAAAIRLSGPAQRAGGELEGKLTTLVRLARSVARDEVLVRRARVELHQRHALALERTGVGLEASQSLGQVGLPGAGRTVEDDLLAVGEQVDPLLQEGLVHVQTFGQLAGRGGQRRRPFLHHGLGRQHDRPRLGLVVAVQQGEEQLEVVRQVDDAALRGQVRRQRRRQLGHGERAGNRAPGDGAPQPPRRLRLVEPRLAVAENSQVHRVPHHSDDHVATLHEAEEGVEGGRELGLPDVLDRAVVGADGLAHRGELRARLQRAQLRGGQSDEAVGQPAVGDSRLLSTGQPDQPGVPAGRHVATPPGTDPRLRVEVHRNLRRLRLQCGPDAEQVTVDVGWRARQQGGIGIADALPVARVDDRLERVGEGEVLQRVALAGRVAAADRLDEVPPRPGIVQPALAGRGRLLPPLLHERHWSGWLLAYALTRWAGVERPAGWD